MARKPGKKQKVIQHDAPGKGRWSKGHMGEEKRMVGAANHEFVSEIMRRRHDDRNGGD